MRAVVLERFGPPEALLVQDVPEPAPGPGQVLVDVEFANVTFVETQIRAGMYRDTPMTPALPGILGTGVGGAVAALGPDAEPSLLGATVIARTGGTGGYAERAAVAAAEAIPVPAGLDPSEAVALMADGRTALALMQITGAKPGETVLVHAAAGGVGSLLVQLCHQAGATVIAAARGERKLELARRLGAHAVVDYGRPGWTEALDGVDVVFDGVGGAMGREAFGCVRAGGRVHAFGAASGAFIDATPEAAAARDVMLTTGIQLGPDELRALTRAALDAGAAGRVRPIVGQRFRLEDAARAHAAIEARETLGKTLLVAAPGGGRDSPTTR